MINFDSLPKLSEVRTYDTLYPLLSLTTDPRVGFSVAQVGSLYVACVQSLDGKLIAPQKQSLSKAIKAHFQDGVISKLFQARNSVWNHKITPEEAISEIQDKRRIFVGEEDLHRESIEYILGDYDVVHESEAIGEAVITGAAEYFMTIKPRHLKRVPYKQELEYDEILRAIRNIPQAK